MTARSLEIALTYVYDALGTILSKTGEADNSITYAGYQYDEESGLYYVNARYYDSSMARFLTEDTYRGSQNDPLSLNRYTYCHNNPIRYYDPSGHFMIAALVSAAVGAVVGAAIDYVDQKYIQKKDDIDVGSIIYEAAVGGVFGAIGGGIGARAAKKASQFAIKQTAKTVARTAVKTGLAESAGGFVADVGKQMAIDGKSLDEVDYGKAAKTAAVAGVTGAIGSTIGSVAKVAKSKVKSKATKYADDVTDKVAFQAEKKATAAVDKANKATTTSIANATPSSSIKAPSSNKGNSYVDAIQNSNKNMTSGKASPSTVKNQVITGRQSSSVVSGDTGFRKMDLQFFAEKGTGKGVKGGSNSVINRPSARTQINNLPETKAPNALKASEVTNSWDNYLGSNTTNVHPITSRPDPNRIFSSDATRSIRLGNHEMKSFGTTKSHFHYESWDYNATDDIMTISNIMQRFRD